MSLRTGEKREAVFIRHAGRRWSILFTAAALGVAFAALAASAGRVSTARHAMTPASGTGSPALFRSIGRPLAGASGTVLFPSCQLTTPAGCYGPDQIRAAYGIQPLLDRGLDGSGRTIAIVEAYGSPTIDADLAQFDATWGLPDPTSFQVVAPFGVDATDPDNAAGWAGETSLDVEWAHAAAPGATILLVVAKSSDDADILDATQWILDHNAADVVSQSYGEAEQCMDPALLQRQHDLFHALTRRGITLFASSGDQGAAQYTCDDSGLFKATSTPASDPYVTGVGGTRLNADGTSGAYQSESTWNQTDLLNQLYGASLGPQYPAAGGGGVSVIYRQPDYQAKAAGDTGMRTVPDVSYDAAVIGGVIVVWGGGYYRFGGTSVGSPQWAGLAAIADQLAHSRVGSINRPLYAAGREHSSPVFFHDIADGSNNSVPDLTPYFDSAYGTPIDGFTAVPGYDLATGLGTPIASTLVPYLAHNASTGDENDGGNGGNEQGGNGPGNGGGDEHGGNGGGNGGGNEHGGNGPGNGADNGPGNGGGNEHGGKGGGNGGHEHEH